MCWRRPTTWRSSQTRSAVTSMISSEASVRFEQMRPTRAQPTTASQRRSAAGPAGRPSRCQQSDGGEQRSADLLLAPAPRSRYLDMVLGRTRSDGRAGDRCGSHEVRQNLAHSHETRSARLIGTSAYFCVSAKLRSGPDFPRRRRSEPPPRGEAECQGWAGRVRQEDGKPRTGPLHRSSGRSHMR
jgi:hypothetical protein